MDSLLWNLTVKASVSVVTAYYIHVSDAVVVSIFISAEAEQVLIVDVG
jgi:hypothetical protein